MDEPFSALDTLIRRGLQDEFQELSRTMEKITIFITHDLDEAMRMGSRIGITRDGEMVKIGTPEDIIIHPEDGYVADFVQGLSRLKLIFAHRIMEQPETYDKAYGNLADVDTWPQDHPKADLNSLVSLIIGQQCPIAIRSDGKLAGIVTKDALLKGLQRQSS